MAKKCPRCNSECGENDKFCSQCGSRLFDEDKIDIKKAIEQFETSSAYVQTKKLKTRFSSENVKKLFENTALSTCIFLIALLCAFCFIMFFILDNHQNQKELLQYKNLMENPSQIPLLKEPASYSELSDNISSVEKFLLMYLKNSSDTDDKKNSIFANYLSELDKLPNVLNEKFSPQDIQECSFLKSADACCTLLNDKFSNTAIKAYNYAGSIFLYPDYKFIKNKYKNYIPSDFKKYVELRAKYNYPVSFGLDLNIKPKKLADKIADFEKLYLKTQNEYIKEDLEKIIYNDLRRFIFTPSIYSTMTQEMQPEYKNAYIYFIKKKKDSPLRSLIMSYLDKKRAYGEVNFENDYLYKMFNNETFDDNVKNSVFSDIFTQLRKNIFTNQNSNLPLAFVYNLSGAKWTKYNPQKPLVAGEYVLSEPDENNNVSIYNHAFSPLQELNILKYSKMYLISGNLYIFNKDKLSISKVTFNGKTFNLYTLNHVDVTSLFPGIEVINIDSFPSYNVLIEKDNANATYIILSRYSQGWNDYNLDSLKGDFTRLLLPNMFSVNSVSDVVISFHGTEVPTEEFIENKPAYKFTIHTLGYAKTPDIKEDYTQFDEKTKNDDGINIIHKPNIMPKLLEREEKPILEDENPSPAPSHQLEPPGEKESE